MAETLNVNIDYLPELGTKAAAVAAIESLIFRAIGAKDLEPLQLRYWLDAYYQARRAQDEEGRADDSRPYEEKRPAEDVGPYTVRKISEEELREVADLHAYLHDVIQKAAKAAGIEIEEDGGPPRAPAPTEEERGADVSAPPEQAAASGGQEERIATAPSAPRNDSGEDGGKRARQRPVGWTDDFEPVELKKSGAAEAAAYKREVLARLQEIRSRGVTVPQIVKVAEGNITEDQVRAILEARRVPVAVYRVLSAALDQVEKSGLPRGARRPRND